MSVRIEFVKTGRGLGVDGFPEGTITKVIAHDVPLTNAASAVLTAPDGYNTVMVTPRSGDAVVNWDAAGTPAAQLSGKFCPQGVTLLLGIAHGDKLTVIAATP